MIFIKILSLNNQVICYKNSYFFVDEKFKKYIENLTKSKRYNIRTNKHMINEKQFDINDYEKHMSHQPMKIVKVLK